MGSNISRTSATNIDSHAPSDNTASKYKRFLSWLSATWLIQSIGNTWLGKRISYLCSLIYERFTTSDPVSDSEPDPSLNPSNLANDIPKQLLAPISVPEDVANAILPCEDLLDRRNFLLNFISDKWTKFADNLIEQDNVIGRELLPLIKRLATSRPPITTDTTEQNIIRKEPINNIEAFCKDKPQLDQLVDDLATLKRLEDAIHHAQQLNYVRTELPKQSITHLPIQHNITTERGLALQIQDEATKKLNESLLIESLQTQRDLHALEYKNSIHHFAVRLQAMLGHTVDFKTEFASFTKTLDALVHIQRLKDQKLHLTMQRAIVSVYLTPTDDNIKTAAEQAALFFLKIKKYSAQGSNTMREELHNECKEYFESIGQDVIQKIDESTTNKADVLIAKAVLCTNCQITDDLFAAIKESLRTTSQT